MRCASALAAFATLTVAGCSTSREVPVVALPESHLISSHYGATRSADVQTLVVVLHADQDSARLSEQDNFARAAAASIPNSAAVAILRPGYSDASGKQSPGDRGTGIGDNYTPEQIAEVAQSITAARARYPNARTLLVGENGGAAIAANLAGLRPDLFDGMVLVSCPCALPEWREHMERIDRAADWDAPVRSLDPLQTAGGVRPSLKVAILSGADDRRTPARFARAYAEALALRGIATEFRILPDKGDGILLDPAVLETTRELAATLPAGHRTANR